MTYEEFLEILAEYFEDFDITDCNIVGQDVTRAYHWVMSRYGRCRCQLSREGLLNVKICATLRVIYMNTYSTELDMKEVNRDTLNAMRDYGLLTTQW